MLCFGDTRIVHTTLHVGVAQAVALITRERVNRVIAAADAALRRLGVTSPKLYVSGLNPPYVLKAISTDNSGTIQMYSVSMTGGRTNINAITDVAVAAAASSNNPDNLYAMPDRDTYRRTSDDFESIISKLQTVLAPLFALYHMWTPWLAIGRMLSVLPLVFVVSWKRNLYLGMAAHILGNSVDALAGAAFIIQQL